MASLNALAVDAFVSPLVRKGAGRRANVRDMSQIHPKYQVVNRYARTDL